MDKLADPAIVLSMSMFMLSFIFVIFLFPFICIANGDPIIKSGRVGIPLIGLALPHFCVCLKTELGLPMLYIVIFFFACSDLRREVIVYFVGIVDHHCHISMFAPKIWWDHWGVYFLFLFIHLIQTCFIFIWYGYFLAKFGDVQIMYQSSPGCN